MLDAADLKALKAGFFDFLEKSVMPIQLELAEIFENPRLYWREDGRLCDEVVEARRRTRMLSAAAGYYQMFCPEELGGGGLGATDYFEVWEDLCYRYGSPQTSLPFYSLAHTSTGPTALWLHASPELRDEVLPRLVEGEIQGTFAMSEPDAGSDAWMMTTRARRDGEDWVIDGQKQWATWGPTAEFALVFAVTDVAQFSARRGGLTCFFVTADTPGFSVDSIVKVHDELGGEECVISLDAVRVPDAWRIGPEGAGFEIAMQGSGQLKLTKLARAIGLTRWAHRQAITYAGIRSTFGKTLSEHDVVGHMIARNAVDLHAARLLADDVARRVEAGEQARREMALSYAFVFESMFAAYDRSMQILGGIGVSNEMKMIHGWHTLRDCRITEGPTEIQMRTIARMELSPRSQQNA